MTEDDLNNLLSLAQSGDREAFGVIYDQYSGKIYKFIFFRVNHKEVAEDILSDTFVKAWNKISQIQSPQALSSWLYQVAKNNIIDYYRIKKETVSLQEVESILEDPQNIVEAANLSLEQTQLLELIRDLPPDQASVIQYKFFEELENAEIAQIMNKTEGAVRVIQHRAVANLKKLLNQKLKHKKRP
ncbi:MAG: sigma-70 family RNA polymerase sigma factor [Candidatus Doudnabacteria bacterium]|nr:sigma-70 family RNA polymerase sigma factor [Candidatus Doudnabacteria bacterium]